MKRGLFITFEGGEGTGKSTQIGLLARKLEGLGRGIVTTREPGGTPEAEKIRELLVHRKGGNWTPMAECLLLFSARVMHVEGLIKPALAEGKVVICDRFADSTRAYQGYGHGLPLETIEGINGLTLDDFAPDMTFIMDLPVDVGLSRAGKRLDAEQSGEDRFERLGHQFHERMRRGYLEIARRAPERCIVVDADRGAQEIADEIWSCVKDRMA